MRVLIVHNRYKHPGGEDVVVAAELAMLRRMGDEVIEFVDDNRRIDHMGRLATAATAVWSRATHRDLLAVLRAERPDVVHFHNTFPLISPAAYYACREEGVPVVQTLHNYRLLCPAATLYREGRVCEDCLGKFFPVPGVVHRCYHGSRLETAVVGSMLSLHRLLGTWQDKVNVYVALTEFARKVFVRGGLPESRIVVKPNFVFPDPGPGDGSGRFALFVGRLSAEKGLLTLLEAWERIDEIPLKIVGDGPMMTELAALVRRRGLRSVQLLGRKTKEDLYALMKAATFLVFPSEWYEGFPVTIAEAFACGVPVIASRIGAMAEIVEHGRTGWLFTPGDAQGLREAVERAWRDPEAAGEIRRAARAEYLERYTVDRNYEALRAIYERAMREAPS